MSDRFSKGDGEGAAQKIMDDIWSFSIRRLRTFPGPRRCSCPTYSSSETGRILSASGILTSEFISALFVNRKFNQKDYL